MPPGPCYSRCTAATHFCESSLLTCNPSLNSSLYYCSVACTQLAPEHPWHLGSTFDPEAKPHEVDVSAAVTSLVSHITSTAYPSPLCKASGPEPLVDIFIDAWVSEMRQRSISVEALPTFYLSKCCYATLATIPPPPAAFAQCKIELATSADVDCLALLFADFTTAGPHPVPLDIAKKRMDASVQLREVWVYRLDDDIAGYCAMGMMTPRTVTLKNVYVAPKHRRKGIAEAMVALLIHCFLGVEYPGTPAGDPPGGVKQEVCLNVIEEHVEKLYKKCGFMLEDDARDPATGRRGWRPAAYRGVQMVTQ